MVKKKPFLSSSFQPYFEPEPPATAAAAAGGGPEVSGAQRTSVFDPRPSLTILPPSTSPINMGESGF